MQRDSGRVRFGDELPAPSSPRCTEFHCRGQVFSLPNRLIATLRDAYKYAKAYPGFRQNPCVLNLSRIPTTYIVVNANMSKQIISNSEFPLKPHNSEGGLSGLTGGWTDTQALLLSFPDLSSLVDKSAWGRSRRPRGSHWAT